MVEFGRIWSSVGVHLSSVSPRRSYCNWASPVTGTACHLAVLNIERTECLKNWLRSNIISRRLVATDIVAGLLNRGAVDTYNTKPKITRLTISILIRD